MFRLILREGHIFKNIIESMKDLIQETNMYVTKDGIRFNSMDACHVSLISCVLSRDAFEVCEVTDGEYVLGVSIQSLSKILKFLGNKESLELRYDENDTLGIIFREEGVTRLEFELNLMDIDDEEMDIPKNESDIEFMISSSVFQKNISSLMVIGDTCEINCTPGLISLQTNGDIGELKLPIQHEHNEEISHEFSLRHLSIFSKASSLSSDVRVSIFMELPLCLSYDFGNGYLEFYLAPKISED